MYSYLMLNCSHDLPAVKNLLDKAQKQNRIEIYHGEGVVMGTNNCARSSNLTRHRDKVQLI